MQQDRLVPADVIGKAAVPVRLPRLPLQTGMLGFQRADDIVQALQIAFRRFQAQFGLVPA